MSTTDHDRHGPGDRTDAPLPDDVLMGAGLGTRNHLLQRWLVQQRNAGATPADVTEQLIAAGWDADTSARVSLRSLRSADRQSLTYAGWCWSTGLAALGLASSAHLVLSGNPAPMTLTLMLTLTIVAGPIAVVCAVAARRVERRSRFVLWSPTRRGWFGLLALCTGVVGLVRLLSYVFGALATLTGASDDDLSVAHLAQVLVSVAIAVPLFVWSFHEWRRSNLVITALGHEGDPASTDDA
jgi:hypothetical protein